MKPAEFPDFVRKTQDLHDEFQKLTDQQLALSTDRILAWHEFIKRGYSIEDLRLLVRWTKIQMKRPGSGFSSASLQFRTMILGADKCEDRINIARKDLRKSSAISAPKPIAAPESHHELRDLSDEELAQGAEAIRKFRENL